MKTIGEVLVGSPWYMERWDKYYAAGRRLDGTLQKLRTIDGLACPECGALAERIGHEYDVRGGEETGFEQDTLYITRREHGWRWRGDEPGVVAIDNASASTSRTGATVKTSNTTYALAVTHLCPKCGVVFPAAWCRPWHDTDRQGEERS